MKVTYVDYLCVIFGCLGVLGAYSQIDIIYNSYVSNSIDQLVFQKNDTGPFTVGHQALLLHASLLFCCILMMWLGLYSLKKIIRHP